MGIAKTTVLSLTVAVLFSGGALGKSDLPSLTPEQMNCANTKITDDSGLSETQARAVAESFVKVWKAREHDRRYDVYTLAFCGTTRNGHHFVILDGIYIFLGIMVCDDTAGFGVVYDPKDKTFGDIVFGVSSCAPSKQQ